MTYINTELMTLTSRHAATGTTRTRQSVTLTENIVYVNVKTPSASTKVKARSSWNTSENVKVIDARLLARLLSRMPTRLPKSFSKC